MVEPSELEQYLTVAHHSKRWIRDRVADLLMSEKVVPSFSAAAVRLAEVSRDENAGMDEIAKIIAMDPGWRRGAFSRNHAVGPPPSRRPTPSKRGGGAHFPQRNMFTEW